MAVNLSLFAGAGAQFFNNSGVILSGGLVYTYAAGTTTPQTAYTTSSGSTAHTNPIVLDSAGRVPSGGEIWLTDAVAYKFVLQTSTAVLIATYDNVTGNASGIYTAFAASSGSSLVGFIQSGTGAVATTVQAKLRQTVSVKDFGAVGDGTTNDTAAIQLALNTSSNVYFPVGNYRVTAQLNIVTSGQTVYGDGDLSILTADSGTFTVLRAYNVNDVTVKGLKIVGAGSSTGISDGACLQFTNVNYGTATGLHCTNYGFAGVLMQISYYMDVGNNLFTSAAGSTAADVICNYAGGYNNIHDNFCYGAGAYGIAIQTILTSPVDYQNYNQIINNQVGTHNSYGIMLYANTANSVYGSLVSGNIITGITGSRADPTYGLTYGAGIYLQGDNQTICSGNVINQCNTSTAVDLLAPGAIGSTNSGNKIISNNTITDTAWYGITVRDPNGTGVAGEQIVIEGNILRNCGTNSGQASIQINKISNVSVIGNRIYNQAAGVAISQTNTTTTDGIIISENVINTFQYGIFLTYARSAIVSNNILVNPTSNVMQLENCNYCSVIGNNIQSGTQAGFNIRLTGDATYLDNLVQGNKITSNQAASAGNYGIWVDSAYATNSTIKDNDLSGCIYLNQQTNKLVDAGTNTSVSGNKFGLGPLTGTFTLGAAASTTVANTSAGYWTTIMLMPTNAAAATLVGSAKALYISAKTNDTSFAVTTADGAAAAGTETFTYALL